MSAKALFERWDHELAAMELEIASLAQSSGHGPRTARRDLLSRKTTALRAAARLERVLKALEQLTAKELLLLPREKALFHWTKTYAERLRAHAARRGDVMTKNHWLRLVRARLAIGVARVDGISVGDDLVGLSIRKASLGKTETYLDGQLTLVKKEQRRLVEAYHELAVEHANREASRALGARLGETWDDARESPILRGLADFLAELTAGVRGDAAASRFLAVHGRYAQKSATMMSFCRDLVLGKARGGAERTDERLRRAVRQLSDLEDEVQVAYAEIRAARLPEARPVLPQTARAAVETSKIL